jgi:hypothetical protein
MRSKLLGLSAVACLVAVAAWLVHRNDGGTESEFAASAHAAEPQASQAQKTADGSRETTARGLEYLVKHQFADGHREGDGGKHPVAMTGLVGLALLMEKDDLQRGRGLGRLKEDFASAKYVVNLRKAADWLMEQSQHKRDGLIFSEHFSETTRYMEGHGLATLFLAGMCRDETDPARQKKLTEAVTRAVSYIAKAQSSQGGWYHTSRLEGHDFDDVLVTAIQIQALQAAENAGIALAGSVLQDALEYMKAALEKKETGQPEHNSSGLAATAAALACRLNTTGVSRRINGDRGINPAELKDELGKNGLKYCQGAIAIGRAARFGKDELAHYYYAQALHKGGGDAWSSYRKTMFDQLRQSQNKDGSWPASKGIGAGPVYSTALWCTVLQLEKETHPSRRPAIEIDIVTRRCLQPGLRLGFVVNSAAKLGA